MGASGDSGGSASAVRYTKLNANASKASKKWEESCEICVPPDALTSDTGAEVGPHARCLVSAQL